ncbi:MAG: dUTP diphosphatase [Rhodospirillaceae bacterium]|nr:dUTP diphosphatase [Rhodospirillaceae bacterium]|tara:strand:+ start:26158 stop:26607 length:450 start_codon:yes stop_codon:yes gene_type:complete
MVKPRLLIKRLENNDDLPLPKYETTSAAGMDLPAAVKEEVVIKTGETALVPTGISIALPAGYEAQVRPRSGLAARDSVTVLNSPGTIDEDYRGEIQVILINHGKSNFIVSRGMRIAQLIIAPTTQVEVDEVDTLSFTERGSGGFGSTGR